MRRMVLWLGAVVIAAGAQWGQCDEPKPSEKSEPAKATTEPVFEVVLLTLKSDWQAMRYHTQTGEAWYAFQGNWKPVPEADNAKPPAGDYRIQLSPTGENDWIAIRVERKSGRTWRLAALKWAEMKVLDPEPPKERPDLKL